MLLRRASVWLVLLLSLGSVVALASPMPFAPQILQTVGTPFPPERHEKGVMQELALTPEQKQQLKAIQRQYKGQMVQQQRELLQAQQDLSALMAGIASENEIRSQYRQVEALRQEMGELHLDSLLAMREVLTPDQRRRFAALMERRENFRVRQSAPVGRRDAG